MGTSKPSVTMIRQKLLIVCLLFSLGSSQISFGGPPPEKEENKCTTPDGKEGECIGLRRCNNILVLLRKPIATEAIKYLYNNHNNNNNYYDYNYNNTPDN